MGEAHLFPIFFLHTMHTFSSVMMHFTCWCRMRSSWTWEQRDWGEVPLSGRQEEGPALPHLPAPKGSLTETPIATCPAGYRSV